MADNNDTCKYSAQELLDEVRNILISQEMTLDDLLDKVFPDNDLTTISATKFMEELKAYEERKKINVGNIIARKYGNYSLYGVVTRIDCSDSGTWLTVLWDDGSMSTSVNIKDVEVISKDSSLVTLLAEIGQCSE